MAIEKEIDQQQHGHNPTNERKHLTMDKYLKIKELMGRSKVMLGMVGTAAEIKSREIV